MYWFNKYQSYLKSPQAYYYFLEKTDLNNLPLGKTDSPRFKSARLTNWRRRTKAGFTNGWRIIRFC